MNRSRTPLPPSAFMACCGRELAFYLSLSLRVFEEKELSRIFGLKNVK
jgi:hypothetical protein